MRFVPACAQNRAALGENPGELFLVQPDGSVLHQPHEPIQEAHQLHIILTQSSFSNAAQCCIQAWAVTASS